MKVASPPALAVVQAGRHVLVEPVAVRAGREEDVQEVVVDVEAVEEEGVEEVAEVKIFVRLPSMIPFDPSDLYGIMTLIGTFLSVHCFKLHIYTR